MEKPPHERRNLVILVLSNLLAGVGVASGAAVGALLAEQLGGTAMAGLAQAVGILAAAVASIPLATLAQTRGRRWALSLGYALSTVGAVLIVTAAVLGQLVVLLVGLTLYGVANATNLQSRYAAADNVGSGTRARTMSVVLWSTTVGSVVGPNLAAPGAVVGQGFGVPDLGGPYLFSVVAYLLAGLLLAALYRDPVGVVEPVGRAGTAAGAATAAGATEPGGVAAGATEPGGVAAAPDAGTPPARARRTGALGALRWAWAHPRARFAVVTTAAAHAVMIMVMVMTPVHMQHGGMSLQLVGIVISLHVLGMFALSPVFGWLADRFGPLRVAVGGMVLQGAAVVLGFTAAALVPDAPRHAGHGAGPALDTEVLTAVALVLLGLGWSACVIASSAVLAAVAEPRVKLPLQGATDALMNYFGAGAAALAGPLLAWGGFEAVNTAGAVLLAPAVVAVVLATRSRAPVSDPQATRVT
ncbi:MFS transporter [Promicromonospora thailandica]|uniref:Major Facilitator Superfamily protein n=1 Tax=Promicromonospora thailandica TaxID=765201 RepID=A0A9X2JTE2_9MICO|nr:MFS transporter [Promicromonospora thailandica]MCP2263340.1 Major Facilitator Superfamily protein [Promicromonospora thailandica]BFF19510.1 MFS transporter [Promicromonospora thailandica]